MSRFTSLYLRVPRPKTLFGLIGLQTGAELISMALVFNKITGVYGLLAILTGYELNLLQLTTYVYSIAVLALLVYLIPHIRKQSPLECLALAWVYVLDTVISGAYTASFGLEWYFDSAVEADNPVQFVHKGLDGLRKESEIHGKVVPQETATSMLLIIALTLIRFYFSFVVMAFAQHTLQKYIHVLILEGPGVDQEDGPFALDLPDGEGRRGRLGRLMVSYGRGYWLGHDESDSWMNSMHARTNSHDGAPLPNAKADSATMV